MSKWTKDISRQVQLLIEEDAEAVISALLEEPFWPQELHSKTAYARFDDDANGILTVTFSEDGDGWAEVVEIISEPDPNDFMLGHRFRTFFGGGESLRVRNALILLARAIDLDNEARPQDNRVKKNRPAGTGPEGEIS